jgi:FkbM family methyltransferase
VCRIAQLEPWRIAARADEAKPRGQVLAFRIRKYAREHRKSWLARSLARQCRKFLHGYYNEGFYDLHANGEARVIETVVDTQRGEPLFVFDVGAHRGEWAKVVLERRPDARIYCFEIVPETATALRHALADHPTAHACAYGLSSTARDVQVFWNRAWDTMSSITPLHENPLFANHEVTAVTCEVDTGDATAIRLAIPRITLLKMDVEGHEIEVLRGFAETLRSTGLRPRVIQFEYGETWLPARHTLREAYQLLEPHGYAVGRLYPDGVEFKPYASGDDHFRMGNYIAVQSDDPLAARLACFQTGMTFLRIVIPLQGVYS